VIRMLVRDVDAGVGELLELSLEPIERPEKT
jgi:hypothetical protein